MKTSFKPIGIGERNQNRSELKFVSTKGKGVCKGWSELTQKYWGQQEGGDQWAVLNTLSCS